MKDESRRNFIMVAGAAVIGGVGAPVVAAVASKKDKTPGKKQWGMVIDLKRCLQNKGCTRCIDICHEKHNVPDLGDDRYKLTKKQLIKQEIKWIWKADYEKSFPDQQHSYTNQHFAKQPIPVLCNHCIKPACVRVCPTGATWKRESDGVVMMDMHRCIGCRYCIVSCPYGARSFNFRDPWPRPFGQHPSPPNMSYPTRGKGVVEKCNFCAERIAACNQDDAGLNVADSAGRKICNKNKMGEPVPYCVEVCPSQALAFGDLNDERSSVRMILARPDVHAIRRKPGLGTEPCLYYIV